MQELPKEINRLIGRAMLDYSMLSDGDRVLVAVSGGIDSLVLARVLTGWRRKAPIEYSLLAVHLDMRFKAEDAGMIEKNLHRLNLPVRIENAVLPDTAAEKIDCFVCARQRRKKLFEIARQTGCNKLALGHHRDDIIETFFMNLFYSGNISTMVPRQDLFSGKLAIIRPLAYLDKAAIQRLAEQLEITATAGECPFSADSSRTHVRQLLASLLGNDPRLKANVFAALANVKPEHLLRRNRVAPEQFNR